MGKWSKIMNFFSPEVNNTLYFGGTGGSLAFLNNPADAWVAIYYDTEYNVLRSVQIGNTVYGGSGGSEQGREQLAPDGTCILKEIWCRNSLKEVSYLVLDFPGGTLYAGDPNNKGDDSFTCNLKVRFSGIRYGQRVNQLQFQLVQ